ncbi:winged helix-turn-helix domain-containing protein [Methanolapillus ohkumae]|uniref:Methanogenesis regulatory protein FilR1 middle domain-containing protein n=1 Tax=Methanolapillus ohkumae TaxID=3028298 RepID=A0AA96ZWH4_9EURY|nr:hypothetical protein MsAm2_15810 [Methanosarcinaceae archaeon Am2]
MKDESLTDTLFLSEKRRQILLYLISGPKTIEEIKENLHSKSSPIMVQIRILIRSHLVMEKNGMYELTGLGKSTVFEMVSILDMFSVFDSCPDYWTDVDLEAFPTHLLNRIGELGQMDLYVPDRAHIFDCSRQVFEELKDAGSVIEISSIFRKTYVKDYVSVAEKGFNVTFVLSNEVLERIENEFPEIYYRYMRLDNVRFFIAPEMKMASCLITDKFVSLSLLTKDGKFFNHDLVSRNKNAINWGIDLFYHYRALSKIHQLQE